LDGSHIEELCAAEFYGISTSWTSSGNFHADFNAMTEGMLKDSHVAQEWSGDMAMWQWFGQRMAGNIADVERIIRRHLSCQVWKWRNTSTLLQHISFA
jgi:hypothetical protein